MSRKSVLVDPASLNKSRTRDGEQRRRMRMACFPCSKAKVSCDDQRPCSRCCKKGITDQCRDRDRPLNRTKPTGPSAKKRKAAAQLSNESTAASESFGELVSSQNDSESRVSSGKSSSYDSAASCVSLVDQEGNSLMAAKSREPSSGKRRKRKSSDLSSSSTPPFSSSKSSFSSSSATNETTDALIEGRWNACFPAKSLILMNEDVVASFLMRRHGFKKYSPFLLRDLLLSRTMQFHRFLLGSKLILNQQEYDDLHEEAFQIAMSVCTSEEEKLAVSEQRSRSLLLKKNFREVLWTNTFEYNAFEISTLKNVFGADVMEQISKNKLTVFKKICNFSPTGDQYEIRLSSNVQVSVPPKVLNRIKSTGQDSLVNTFTPFAVFNMKGDDPRFFVNFMLSLIFTITPNSFQTFVKRFGTESGFRSVLACVIHSSRNPKEDSTLCFVFKFLDSVPQEEES